MTSCVNCLANAMFGCTEFSGEDSFDGTNKNILETWH
jgi:hypothetical protein